MNPKMPKDAENLGMQTVHAAQTTVAGCVANLALRLARTLPRAISDAQVLMIGLCSVCAHADPTIELLCERRTAAAIIGELPEFAINVEEFKAIVVTLCSRSVSLVGKDDTFFKERIAAIQTALSCTLLEDSAQRQWARDSTKLAVFLIFQSMFEPVPILDLVFDSVIRSDARRVDDLHFECRSQGVPPLLLASCLEACSGAVL